MGRRKKARSGDCQKKIRPWIFFGLQNRYEILHVTKSPSMALYCLARKKSLSCFFYTDVKKLGFLGGIPPKPCREREGFKGNLQRSFQQGKPSLRSRGFSFPLVWGPRVLPLKKNLENLKKTKNYNFFSVTKLNFIDF